jgi:glycosyltransferase involved in cell wall biosynthesis
MTAITFMQEAFSPLVSIITPTYNHEKFIGPCIDSVIRQTYSNWEQFIIDDGSRDNTARVIAGFRDPRIRYEHQENQGPFELATTYNRALHMAKGDLIAILEGDDFWPLDKLATLVPCFLEERVVLAYGDRVDVDARGRRQRRKTDTARLREGLPDSILFNDPVGLTTRYMVLEEGRSLVHPCTVVIRRSALERIGGFQYVPGLPLTDYPTFLELSLAGRFFYARQTMGYLRRHQRSVTVNHARTIHEEVSNFTTKFLERHSDKIVLSPSDHAMIASNWRKAEDRLHFSEGRMLLLQRNWSEARGEFRAAARSNSAKVRLSAWVGWLLSWVHKDIESLMRLGGRADLRSDAIERV